MTRILIILSGTSPAVVSLTLYALRERGWVPDAIHVVTTRVGRALLQAPPTHDARGRPTHWQALPIAMKAIFGNAFAVAPQYHAVAHDDTDTPEATHDMANLLARVYCDQAMVDQTCEVHLSVAGGRKAMGWVASQVFALLARPQDQASQVLVDPAYESDRAFYFPGQPESFAYRLHVPGQALERLVLEGGRLVCRLGELDGALYPYRDARVQLVDLPVVRVRDFLAKRLAKVIDELARNQFMQVIRWLDDYLSARVLVLDMAASPAELRVQRRDGTVVLVLKTSASEVEEANMKMDVGSRNQSSGPPTRHMQRSHWAVLAWLAVASQRDRQAEPSGVPDLVNAYFQLLLGSPERDMYKKWKEATDAAKGHPRSGPDRDHQPAQKWLEALLSTQGNGNWPGLEAVVKRVKEVRNNSFHRTLDEPLNKINPFFSSLFFFTVKKDQVTYTHFEEFQLPNEFASAGGPT